MSKKPRIPDANLGELTEWCLRVVKFMNEQAPDNKVMFADLEQGIARALADGNITAMKELAKSLAGWMSVLPPRLRTELDHVLYTTVGIGAGSSAEDVRKILDQGAITSDDEYRLLMRRVDEIFQDRSKKDEVDQINALLASYDAPEKN